MWRQGAWYFGITGGFAPWVGTLIENLDQKIIFIAPEGREKEVVMRLARVGYDNSLGYLEGGIQAWKEAGFNIDAIESITAKEFEKEINHVTRLPNAVKVSRQREQLPAVSIPIHLFVGTVFLL
mgnify:CR=1 FL=1